MEKIQVVLASPSDLADERQMIKTLVDSLNHTYMRKDICFDLRMWEDSMPGMNAAGPQALIDLDLEIPKADLFICMYWKKEGTKLPGEDVAGTEHELNLALDSYHKRGKPDIKVFFKKVNAPEETADAVKISSIAKKLQNQSLYSSFKDSEELKDTIRTILESEVINLIRQQGPIMPDIHNYIEVTDTQGFVSNFSSNNKLVLSKGYYDMLDFEEDSPDKAFKEAVYDGNQLVISNVSNVTVVGDNSTLVVNPRYANVICFRNCSNIKLIGLTLGHTPHKSDCSGSVLCFENCNNIQLEALELFGCGIYGIEIVDCKNIKTNGTKIYECSYGALAIDNSDFEFSNSMIYDCNKTSDCLVGAKNSQLVFDNVSIFNNHIDDYVFSLECSNLFCRGVCVYSNSFAGLCNKPILSGVFEENNKIQCEKGYIVRITSTNKTSREQFAEVKESIGKNGKVSESIFDEGQIAITLITPTYESLSRIERIMESYDNFEMTYDLA